MSDKPTLLTLAEEFYAGNTDLCEGLVSELKASGVPDTFLDDKIHDGADADDRDSDEASSVNNQGFAFQIASILESNGIEEGSRLIRAEMPTPAPRG